MDYGDEPDFSDVPETGLRMDEYDQEMSDYERANWIREMMAKVDETINTSSQIKVKDVDLWLAQQYQGWYIPNEGDVDFSGLIPEEHRWTNQDFEIDDHLRVVDHIMDPDIEALADVTRTKDFSYATNRAPRTLGPVTFSVVDEFSADKPEHTTSWKI
jgi:hypothetical protein